MRRTAKDTETKKKVVYKTLKDGNVWIRPYDMFVSEEDVFQKPENVTHQKQVCTIWLKLKRQD